MTIDFELDSERARQLLILGCGIILGYLCVVLAIELELYYYQSRFVVAKLYVMITDAEKASQFREASQCVEEGVTSSRASELQPEPVAAQSR